MPLMKVLYIYMRERERERERDRETERERGEKTSMLLLKSFYFIYMLAYKFCGGMDINFLPKVITLYAAA